MKPGMLVAALFVIGLFRPAFGETPSAPKPPVGVPADAAHFNGKWYRVYLEKATYQRARSRCLALGGNLACVSDKATHEFIQELAKDVPLWLGATDEKAEGAWVWPDGTEMTFKAWAPKEPQGYRKENYLIIGRGRWHDYSKDEPVSGFICEWRPK